MSAEDDLFVGGWMLCELMGHRVVAGHVVPVNVAGVGMLQITVPCEPTVVMRVRPESIYCLTDIDEAEARRRSARPPVQVMTFDHPALPAPSRAAGYYTEPDPFDGPGVSTAEADDTDPYDEEPDPEDNYDPESRYDDVERQSF